jgi:hypothetical protein
MRRWGSLFLLLLSLWVVACAPQEGNSQPVTPTVSPARATREARFSSTPGSTPEAADTSAVDLELADSDLSLRPLPLRAGSPFTVTALIHNRGPIPAVHVPLMIYISAGQEEIGYSSFLKVLTPTVPASETLALQLPVDWNLAEGEHQLWIQVNRLPIAWQTVGDSIVSHPVPVLPEVYTGDNTVLRQIVVDPFDAYVSDLCPGRIDVEIGPGDVLPEPDQQRVLVQVHNVGNKAVYNLPVVVLGKDLMGIAYTPTIAPCGGTAQVQVKVDRLFEQGESLNVQVNPGEWTDSLAEDTFDNNQVSVVAGLSPGPAVPRGSGLEDYDFSLSGADIQSPEPSMVLITVRNLGTRDAAMVPIRVENEGGRKITDAIPLVQGNGVGVAAIRVGYLWTRGGTLTFTVNPEGVKGAYPEANRNNNVATFSLP